jgi:D-hexose-6-phosphate mutarotase
MGSPSPDELNARHAIPDAITFEAGPGGLARARLTAAGGTATVALQGAHVLAFVPAGQRDLLWLSPLARFAPGQAIRGGIPLCWPWFGPHPRDPAAPAHGLARNRIWTPTASALRPDGRARLVLSLEDPRLEGIWTHAVEVHLEVTVGTTLTLALSTRNASDQPIALTEALHTYLAVSDVSRIAIHGLAGCTYIDKVARGERCLQTGAVTIDAETDRIYLGTEQPCVIHDPGLDRRIIVAKTGSRSTVVWNPWVEKARTFADLPDEGYRTMVCIEAANAADDALTLGPAETHVLGTSIGLES